MLENDDKFGNGKIRVEIFDDKLIFAHNGDPFRPADVTSITSQYSSKSEENKEDSETTGKYGTGFITTYILSRQVRIKGLLALNQNKKGKENKAPKGENGPEGEPPIPLGSQEEIG